MERCASPRAAKLVRRGSFVKFFAIGVVGSVCCGREILVNGSVISRYGDDDG